MINVNIPEIPKEAAVYVVAAVVGAVLIFGVWTLDRDWETTAGAL